MVKLLFLAGSSRKDSVNKKLAQQAYKIAGDMKAEATFVDLKYYQMPIYDGDIEETSGIPENAQKLKNIFAANDGFFIASPEYNSSFSSLLKNSLDWISRPAEGEAPLIAFRKKVAALGAAAPGGLGGIRGLVPLRMMLGNIGVFVTPSQIAVGNAFKVFSQNGTLQDENSFKMLRTVIQELVETASRIR